MNLELLATERPQQTRVLVELFNPSLNQYMLVVDDLPDHELAERYIDRVSKMSYADQLTWKTIVFKNLLNITTEPPTFIHDRRTLRESI